MRAVVDFDNTICIHKNRDFENAIPINETIEKIKSLYHDGWNIVIYSARGQNSCHGDIKLIEERNRGQIEKWLERYGVPYDQIVFGKPLADIYVDDKGVSLKEFIEGDYKELKGNSGSHIYRVADRVIKEDYNSTKISEWYEQARKIGVLVPKVNAVVLDSIDMEYIPECGNIQKEDIYKIISTILLFSTQKTGYLFSTDSLIERVRTHLDEDDDFNAVKTAIERHRRTLEESSSMCHGDLSLSNVIKNEHGLYYIDPIVVDGLSSYLLDYAKLRFSMNGGEEVIKGRQNSDSYLEVLDKYLQENGIYDVVKVLEATYWVRLTGHIERDKEQWVIKKARSVIDQ